MRVMNNKSFFESLQESLNEEIDNSPKDGTLIFDSDDEAYQDGGTFDQEAFDIDYEDVTGLIDDQVNEYLILNGYNKTWDRGGDGFKVKEDLSGIVGNYDGIRVYKNNDGGIDLYLYDHDGYTSGTLYTFKKDSDDEIEKVLQEYFEDDDISLYYFLDWVDAGVLKLLQERGLLVPLKANGVLSESEELEPKFATAKSFYGKAHVDTKEDGTKVLTSYETEVVSVKDGKIDVLCDKSDLTQTTLRHIREFLQQEGINTLPTKKELQKMIDEKSINECDKTDDKEVLLGQDETSIDESGMEGIWGAVCGKETPGRKAKIEKYFTNHEPNKRYNRFDRDNSLIMGALRNGNYNTVDLLMSKGETVTDDEKEEFERLMSKRPVEKIEEQDSTVRVYKNSDSEREYSIVDITELNEISDGDVRPPIDISELLTEVDSRLTESFGNWGTINIQSTRFNKDTNDSNALFELNVGKDTYLMSMLLEENCSVLKVNNTNGKTIFKRKSNDITSLAESYIKQFIGGKESEEVPECIKHISEPLHERLDFINSYIDMLKLAPKENKGEFEEYIQNEIYRFVAAVSDEIKNDAPTEEDKLELPTFDGMVEEIFGKKWVKKQPKEDNLELPGTETLKESYSVDELKDLIERLINECEEYPENNPGSIYSQAIRELRDSGLNDLAEYLDECYNRCDSSYIKSCSVEDDLDYVLSKLGTIKEAYVIEKSSEIKENDLRDREDILVLYNPGLKKERVIKKVDNKWVDNEGNEYSGDLSVDDLRNKFTGGWKRIMSTDEEKLDETLKESMSFEDIVKDSYNHYTSDIGKVPTSSDIVTDIINNYDQDYIKDDTPDASLHASGKVEEVLKKLDLTYTGDGEPRKSIYNDSDLKEEYADGRYLEPRGVGEEYNRPHEVYRVIVKNKQDDGTVEENEWDVFDKQEDAEKEVKMLKDKGKDAYFDISWKQEVADNAWETVKQGKQLNVGEYLSILTGEPGPGAVILGGEEGDIKVADDGSYKLYDLKNKKYLGKPDDDYRRKHIGTNDKLVLYKNGEVVDNGTKDELKSRGLQLDKFDFDGRYHVMKDKNGDVYKIDVLKESANTEENTAEGLADIIKSDVKNDLAIEPGSDEEAMLDSLFEEDNEKEDEVIEPKTGLGTGYASFVRKPSNVEDLDNKAKYFTDGDASYLICSSNELSKDEFDKIQENFLQDNEYCKSFEPLDTDNYSYNVIQFTCPDYDYKLLVDPSGFSYCRYVAKIGGNE